MIALCRICRRACYQWTHEHPDWGSGDAVVDVHWSHFKHPEDDHDAIPSIIDWPSVLKPYLNQVYLSCPYYQGKGSCLSGCYSEPSCITNSLWDTPWDWKVEPLFMEAERRARAEVTE